MGLGLRRPLLNVNALEVFTDGNTGQNDDYVKSNFYIFQGGVMRVVSSVQYRNHGRRNW